MANRACRILGRADSAPAYYKEHWALRDISFEMMRGEAIGILGKNGAGKSTLLQIVAGTLEPTSGVVSTNGRITALLELGSGFDPEFSGRENVLLSAQVSGLSETQAQEKFDDIAAFADIGDFLEQPVKTYSSGMLMRLAFAVQTAVDPKILIVDEALAVGDMFFQAKCMARIKGLLDSGVSLLYVSHDPGTVRQLCSRALLIENGHCKLLGDAVSVSDSYAAMQLDERNEASRPKSAELDEQFELCAMDEAISGRQELSTDSSDEIINARENEEPNLDRGSASADADCGSEINETESDLSSSSELSVQVALGIDAFRAAAKYNRTGNGEAVLANVHVLNSAKERTSIFEFGDEATFRVFVKPNVSLENLNLALKVCNRQGLAVTYIDTRLMNRMNEKYSSEALYIFDWTLDLTLMAETYILSCTLAHPPVRAGDDWVFLDSVPHAAEFSVVPKHGLLFGGYVVLPTNLAINSVFNGGRRNSSRISGG